MEKGLFSKAAWDAATDMISKAVVNQKPAVRIAIMLFFKLIGLVGDDVVAEHLPEPLKEKSRPFFDAILVAKDWDLAIILGADLVVEIYGLVKPKVVIALAPVAKTKAA